MSVVNRNNECPDPGMSPVICPDVQCAALYESQCMYHDGSQDIGCSPVIGQVHPDIPILVVDSSKTPLENRISTIFENIGDQICYMLSPSFIQKMWEIIKDDSELLALHCDITCGCPCNVPFQCPTLIINAYLGTEMAPTGIDVDVVNTNDPSVGDITAYHFSVYVGATLMCTYDVTGTFPSGSQNNFIIPCTESQDTITKIVIQYEVNGEPVFDLTCEVPTQ